MSLREKQLLEKFKASVVVEKPLTPWEPSEIISVETHELSLHPLSMIALTETIEKMTADPDGVATLYLGEEVSKAPKDVEDFLRSCLLFPNSPDFLGVYHEDILKGIVMIDAEDLDYGTRIAPFIFKEHRGQGLMKQAYSLLSHAYDEILDAPVMFGQTAVGNDSMKAVFESAGLVRMNDGPCSSVEFGKEVDFFCRPEMLGN